MMLICLLHAVYHFSKSTLNDQDPVQKGIMTLEINRLICFAQISLTIKN